MGSYCKCLHFLRSCGQCSGEGGRMSVSDLVTHGNHVDHHFFEGGHPVVYHRYIL